MSTTQNVIREPPDLAASMRAVAEVLDGSATFQADAAYLRRRADEIECRQRQEDEHGR